MSNHKLKFVKRAEVEDRNKVLAEIENNLFRDELSQFTNLAQKIAIKNPNKVKEMIQELEKITA